MLRTPHLQTLLSRWAVFLSLASPLDALDNGRADQMSGQNPARFPVQAGGFGAPLTILLCFLCVALFLVVPSLAMAEPASFDLAGPRLDIRVTDGGRTLPIAEVPNLLAGEQLTIRADFPPDQSARYLLVVGFLQGATNPPPKAWFYTSRTWDPKQRAGLRVTIPSGAQQVLVFLAPETGGDFATLVDAVRGRPGAFVRAAQDLGQATLDRSRLDTFLSAIRTIDQADPDRLKTASPVLARSLAIKLDAACLEKIPALQAPCLMQGRDALVLDDERGGSLAEALTSGSSASLVQDLSATPQAGFGYYSAYVASVIDIVRLLGSVHTAHYQYIPALVTEQGDQLSLLLNAAPSFHDPMSVLVVALAAIEPAQPPLLRAVDADAAYCAEKPDLVLPVEGAPLVFSTAYDHNMVLRLKAKDGGNVDLPVSADAEKGGFVADTAGLGPGAFTDTIDGALQGRWGFAPYSGPVFHLRSTAPQAWRLAGGDAPPLVAGHESDVRLQAPGAPCVESIALKQASGDPAPVDWSLAGPDQILVKAPLKGAGPGEAVLLIKSYGQPTADTVPLKVFSAPGHLDGFSLHAGDLTGVLKGGGLDQVKALRLAGASFTPDPAAPVGEGDGLALTTTDATAAAKLKPGETATAKVVLQDGRTLDLAVTVGAARPRIALIAKSVQPADPPGRIRLADPDALPSSAQLTFSVHAEAPASFSGDEKIEVATVHGAFSTVLTAADGLTLEDSEVAVARLDPAKSLGASAAGPLRFRIIDSGVAGDWLPLATLVRLPALGDIDCSAGPGQPCVLSGSDLFLIDALSADPAFDHPVQVPEGFTGEALTIPHPRARRLYVKLRDDPSAVDPVEFPAKHPAASAHR